jgi:hypothetical protein
MPEPSLQPIPIDVASIVDPGSTMVRCEYAAGAAGELQLTALLVVPPRLEPLPDDADPRILEVSWRAELQSNELDSIFSANWDPVALSDRQISPAVSSPFLAFQPLRFDYEAAPSSGPSVLRVQVLLEWFGPHRSPIGSGSFVVGTYDPGASKPLRVEGCDAVTAT